ncbi:hypothetical protein [Niallia taxi]|uniref:hypothetical protein n=1 Tax=Niallia taxi TaxID=2499688 RepID=UPI0015F712FA|nr:hypothetical protein [Niallia taxi]
MTKVFNKEFIAKLVVVFGVLAFAFVASNIIGLDMAHAADSTDSLNQNIYSGGDSSLNSKVIDVVKIVAGVGGALFALSFMVMAILIAFNLVSTQQKASLWPKLIGIGIAAIIFFSAYALVGIFKGMA